MKISTKGRYGLEAIVDLAIHSSEGLVNLKSISERCGLPEAYILQIFLTLRRAGIVNSIRGAQGGYVLARSASEITVGEILTTLEGPLSPVACVNDGEEASCERYGECMTRSFWEEIKVALNDVVDSITIEDLVNCYRNSFSNNKEPDYYI